MSPSWTRYWSGGSYPGEEQVAGDSVSRRNSRNTHLGVGQDGQGVGQVVGQVVSLGFSQGIGLGVDQGDGQGGAGIVRELATEVVKVTSR